MNKSPNKTLKQGTSFKISCLEESHICSTKSYPVLLELVFAFEEDVCFKTLRSSNIDNTDTVWHSS